MPWTCDALLPTAARYASLKFRRFSRDFDATKLLWDDAAELVAFLHVVPPARAKWVFHWCPDGLVEARKLWDHMSQDCDVLAMAEENLRAQTAEDGKAVLQAMKDGGFTKGKVPPIVRLYLLELRKQGNSQAKVARIAGLTLDQVRTMIHGRWADRQRKQSVAGDSFWNLTG